MKFRIEKSELVRAIGVTRLALGKGGVTDHVLLRVERDRATMTATDYELSVRAVMAGEALRDGAYAVPGDPLAKIAARLPDGASVTISGADSRVLIECGRTRFDLAAHDGNEFPDVDIATGGAWLLPPAALAAALRAAHCVSDDDGRPSITGMCIDCDGETLTVVATDGLRAGYWQTSNAELEAPRGSTIVHRRAIGALKILATTATEPLAVCTAARHAVFEIGGKVAVQVRTVEANFPAWRSIVPTKTAIKVTLARDGLIAAVARVATIAERAAKTNDILCTLAFDALDGLTLTAAHSLLGTATTSIELTGYAMPACKLGVNPRFLLDALNALSGEHVTLAFNDQYSPVLVTCDEEPSIAQLVMPMRL